MLLTLWRVGFKMVKKNPMAKVIKEYWNSRNQNFKHLLISLSAMVILLFLLILCMQIFLNINDDYITQYNCDSKIIDYHLEHSNYFFWQNFLFEYRAFIGIITISICLSWVFHGFQVRLLA